MRRSPLLVALVLLASCGVDGTGPDHSTATHTGTWALSGADLMEVGNPANQVSLYDDWGLRGTIVFQRDGHFSFRMTVPDEAPVTVAGALHISGDTLFFAYETGYDTKFQLSIIGATMHWVELESQEAWDIDEDGTSEDVINVMDRRKQ